MLFSPSLLKWLLFSLFSVGLTLPCFALEPEPRQWNHLPLGTNFVGVAYAHTDADIFIDPALLLEDVKMELDTWAGKYIRTFSLLDKSSRIDITQAYQKATWTGLLNGTPASATRQGWSDSFVRITMNLYGAPPLRGKAFVAYRSEVDVETIVGMALAIRLPTGDYLKDKLVNLGQNRFVFRPQLGVTHKWGQWSTETTGEIAFYSDNDEFFNGNKLEQKPLYIIHGHLIRTFRPGLWASVSLGYDYGGEMRINGVDKNDKQQNFAWKLSLAYPLNRAAGIKVSYIETRTRETTGFNSETLAAGISFAW